MTFRFLSVLLVSGVALAAEPGSITGVVKFPGEPPPSSMIANRGDHDCPHGIPLENLKVHQENLGLQNAIVYLEAPPTVNTPAKVEIKTEGCRLLPRIQWTAAPASLTLLNKDGAHHHLRALRGGSTVLDMDLDVKDASGRRPLVNPGFYEIRCDRHPWEHAWIYVSPHPYVAQTGKEGRFQIAKIPPGPYAIHVWHEGWVATEPGEDNRLAFSPQGMESEVKVRSKAVTSVLLDQLKPTE